MRRAASFALLVLVAACSRAPAPAPVASPSPTTTSSPGATSSQSPTGTPTPGPAFAVARALAGSFSGGWRNTTLGSIGAARLEVEVDDTGSTMTATLDLDGAFFGSGDAAAATITFAIGEVAMSADEVTDALGPVEAAITDAGLVVLSLDDVPGDQVDTMSARGTADGDGFALSYTQELSNGTTVTGTIDLARVS